MNIPTLSLKRCLQGCASLLALLCVPCAGAQTAASPGPSLVGKCLLADYSEAEMAEVEIYEDNPKEIYQKALKPGAQTIETNIGTFAPVRRIKTFNAKQQGAVSFPASIAKCEQMEGGKVRVTIIPVQIRNNEDALNIANVVNAIDSLSLEQIHGKIVERELDCADSLELTFQSPDSATATGSYASGDYIIKYRNIRVTVETGATPDPVQPDVDTTSTPAPVQQDAGATAQDDDDDDPMPMDNARSARFRAAYFMSELEDLPARDSTTQLYKMRLLTLLPLIADELNPNVTLPETKGNTALHYACGIGNYELVEWLLGIGADPNKRTNKGASPLQCVGGRSATAIRNLLIKHGARK